MNFVELRAAWKCQGKTDFVNLKPEQIVACLKRERIWSARVQLCGDLVVAAVLVGITAFLFSRHARQEIVWPVYVGVALIFGAAAHMPWRTRQWKKREKRFGNSLQDELKNKRARLDHQIRFSNWSGVWVYIVPIISALCLFYWQDYLNGDIDIDMFRGGVILNIVVGFSVHGVFWLSTRPTQRERRKVDLDLEALGCPVPDERTPLMHRLARTILIVVALALCGYLLIQIFTPKPRAGSPVEPVPHSDAAKADRKPRFAKVAPFTGVRWGSDSDQPTVRVRGEWLRLAAVDGIPIDRLMRTARERFGVRAHKRFTEDLVELLAAAGHDPGWTVTLMLDRGDGKGPVPFEEEMTEKKRDAARGYK